MDKAEIIEAIRRCAEENGGVAVGRERFAAMTGIRESDWLGRYWARWGDAVREAGFAPNTLQGSLPEGDALEALARLTRSRGAFPTAAEMKLERRVDRTFPSHNVFSRYGTKAVLAERLIAYCGDDPQWADVVAIARPIAEGARPMPDEEETDAVSAGQVYLMKSGAFYKIGRSNAAGRRAYELAIQLPERLEIVHVIDTDDAVGIERYWHERFADRRANGEWFSLSSSDVAAFRRRKKFM